MKSLLLYLSFSLLLLSGCMISLKYGIKTNTNKTTGARKEFTYNNWIGGVWGYTFDVGKETKNDSTCYFISINYAGDNWALINSAMVIADSEKIDLGKCVKERIPGQTGLVYEYTYFYVDYNTFNKICNSRSIEVFIFGEQKNNPAELSAENIKNIRNFFKDHCQLEDNEENIDRVENQAGR